MLYLLFPWFLLVLIIVALFSLLKKKWKLAFLTIVSSILLNCWCECIPFRFWNQEFKNYSPKLSVVSFNIEGTTGDIFEKSEKVIEIIRKNSPDIVFIAEFNEQTPEPLNSLLKEDYSFTTYPSYYFHYFYSKYPLFNKRILKNNEGKDIGVYACSTVIKGDTIDLYGCHLASNNYNQRRERHSIDNIESGDGFINYVMNIDRAGKQRRIEAVLLINDMVKSTHKTFVMGDMNDVCGSPALKELESVGLLDAWLKGGFGYGATIHTPLPYRIDHIMHSKDIYLKSIRTIDAKTISDHDALYASFCW